MKKKKYILAGDLYHNNWNECYVPLVKKQKLTLILKNFTLLPAMQTAQSWEEGTFHNNSFSGPGSR